MSQAMAISSTAAVVPVLKTDRIEIDTTAPFPSVKVAVTLFGEKVVAEKLNKRLQAGPTDKAYAAKESQMQYLQKETQLHLLQKDLSKLKEQLRKSEGVKKQAEVQLEEAKKVVEDLSSKLEHATKSAEAARKASEIASLRVADLQERDTIVSKTEDSSGLQSEFFKARDEQMAVASELEATKQELMKLRQDFEQLTESRTVALKQAEEEMAKADMNSERANEIQKEIHVAHESHAYLKMATLEIQKEMIAINGQRESNAKEAFAALEGVRKEIEAVKKDIGTAKVLEEKLQNTTEEVEKVQKELDSIKKKYDQESSEASHPIEKLKEITGEILKAKKHEAEALASVDTKTTDIEQAKEEAKKVTEETSSVKGSVDVVKAQLEKTKLELTELNEVDNKSEGRAAELNQELLNTRSKLTEAIAAEQKAKDSVSELSQTLQQLIAETEEAKKEAELLTEEARKAKLETEKANAEFKELEGKLQSADKELEVARTAEAVAMEELKVLFEKFTAARASTPEESVEITISEAEHDDLVKRVDANERVADLKIAAVRAQIDAVKASERELQMKLELVNREIANLKSAEETELQIAKTALAAKTAIEGQLRRRREREQEKNMPKITTSNALIPSKASDVIFIADEKAYDSQLTNQTLYAKNETSKSTSATGQGSRLAAKKKNKLLPAIVRFLSLGKKKRFDSVVTKYQLIRVR